MLIISRKVGESLVIGDEIEVFVSEINGDKVKLAIMAPESIKILRNELVETNRLNKEANKAIDPSTIDQLIRALSQEKNEKHMNKNQSDEI